MEIKMPERGLPFLFNLHPEDKHGTAPTEQVTPLTVGAFMTNPSTLIHWHVGSDALRAYIEQHYHLTIVAFVRQLQQHTGEEDWLTAVTELIFMGIPNPFKAVHHLLEESAP